MQMFNKISIIVIAVLLQFSFLTGQTAGEDTVTVTQPEEVVQTDEGKEIDFGDVVFQIKAEAPQVTLISSRIKPEFDDVHLEKSFVKEIVGAGEVYLFEKKPTVNQRRIDIEQITNKLR